MPSIINLKFKGNKSFVPFSNLNDAESLTMTWKVCTKVAGFLEQGQRLENLSWRLWHLQNIMVDTDNAKSKRDFKKLSKCMGDKLDKEKGRSIEELQAPGYRRTHNTELLQQRALEREREREANQNVRPGTIHRMQFTFSVDQPPPPTASVVKKPDLKPSPEFKDNALKRGRPAARLTTVHDDSITSHTTSADVNDKDAPLTQRGRKPAANDSSAQPQSDNVYTPASLRFPSLFSNDFGPAALLYPTPTVTNPMTYGEGVGFGSHANSDFSIVRPTIELPLDELLNADSPSGWSSGMAHHTDMRAVEQADLQEDVEMKPAQREMSAYSSGSSGRGTSSDEDDTALLTSTAALRNVPPLSTPRDDLVPRTITPTRLAPNGGASNGSGSNKRPSLSVRTQSAARSTGPSATPVNGTNQNTAHNVPGGVKAECSNCGATHTPLWRRGLNDELNCNACGLYCKLHKRPRPKSMRNNHGEGRTQNAPRQESQEVVAQCYNCHTTATPLWRKDDEGKTVCNACGLYYKLHGAARPISMKSDVIRKRARHDARRPSNGAPSETPSASPGASRRPSPTMEATPTLAPDSTTQMYEEPEYRTSMQSELMGALGNNPSSNSNGFNVNSFSFSSPTYNSSSNAFPGPYHPDYLSQNIPSDALPFASAGELSDVDNSGADMRTTKRRRMSNDSASEPPSSAVSYSSFSDFSTSASSSTPHSQRSSVEYPYSSYSYGILRSTNSSAMWHPPMLPPDGNSPQIYHPPMLPPDGSPNLFMHQGLHHDSDDLFATYLHPPVLRADDSPSIDGLGLHPPMLPNDWKASHSYYDDAQHMVTF